MENKNIKHQAADYIKSLQKSAIRFLILKNDLMKIVIEQKDYGKLDMYISYF